MAYIAARIYGGPDESRKQPINEDKFKILANAVVVDNIRFIMGVTVGALSFVNRNVPRGFTAIGIPTQFKRINHVVNGP